MMKSVENIVKGVVNKTALADLHIYPGNGSQRYEEKTRGNIHEFGVFLNGELWLGIKIQPFNGNPNLYEIIDVNKQVKSLDGKGGWLRDIQHVCVKKPIGLEFLAEPDHGNVFSGSELKQAINQARKVVISMLKYKTLGQKYFNGLK